MEKKLILDFDRKQKALKHKRTKEPSQPSSSKQKQPKLEETQFSKPATIYRDRAKERRDGINKDFELDPDDLKISNPTIGNSLCEDGEEPLNEAERRLQQIEESKYLGGDVEHTHLVKGLDFALLEKVKSDQRLAEKLAFDTDKKNESSFGNHDSDSEEEIFINEAIISAAANSKRQIVDLERLKKGQSAESIKCRTAVARRTLNVLEEKWPEKSELFLPGRMTYIIPIGEDSDDPVTTVLTSKADSLAQQESRLPDETDFALDQLINILAKVRQNQASASSTKKLKELEKNDILDDYGY